MLNKELKKELHSIALKNKVSDTVAEMVVMSPFLFQKRKLDEKRLDLEKKGFYHKYIGKFYLKMNVLKKIIEKNGHNK
jgi:hypothetical protein